MYRFNLSFLDKLKNWEFMGFYSLVVNTTEIEAFEEGNVQKSFAELLTHKEDVNFVKRLNAPHPLTSVLREKVMTRKNYLLSISNTIKAGLTSPVVEERMAAKVLSKWLTFNFENRLTQPSILEHNSRVQALFHDYSLRSDVQESVSALNLSGHMDALEDITDEIIDTLNDRTKDLSARSEKAKAIRKAVYLSLKRFFAVIEVEFAYEGAGNDLFGEYVRRLKIIIDLYKMPYNSRMTRLKTAALKAEAEDKGDDPEQVQDAARGAMMQNSDRFFSILNAMASEVNGAPAEIDMKGEVEDKTAKLHMTEGETKAKSAENGALSVDSNRELEV